MVVPIHNCGELNVYLDDMDGDIYLTVETNDHTKTGTGYSISMTEFNRYLSAFRGNEEKTSTTS